MGRRKQASLIQDEPRPAQIDLGIGKAGSGAGQLLTSARAVSRMCLIDSAPARSNGIEATADENAAPTGERKSDHGAALWQGTRKAFWQRRRRIFTVARRNEVPPTPEVLRPLRYPDSLSKARKSKNEEPHVSKNDF